MPDLSPPTVKSHRAVLGVELDWALEPVLHDCASTGIAVEPIRRYLADHPDLVVLGNSLEQNTVNCAEQVQQFLTDASPRWPRCPRHPHSHRLHPAVAVDVACWVCREARTVSTAIGAL